MQNYDVIFSDLAITDLSDIVAYITEQESETRALYVERELLKAVKSLEIFPNGYAKDEYASTPQRTVRFIVRWSYKIVYTVDKNTVKIISIFHTAQDPWKLRFI